MRLKGISEIADDRLGWTDPLEVALSIEIEFKDREPAADPRTVKATLQHHLIDLSVRVGHSDDPRANLDAVRGFIVQDLGIQTVHREVQELEFLRASAILTSRKASPEGTATIALILADRLNEYLDLEPVVAGDLLGLRYRSGNHRFTLVPLYMDRLYSDSEFLDLARGKGKERGAVEVLSRPQFWGRVLSEIGTALWNAAEKDRGLSILERGLGLNSTHAPARVTRARVHIDNEDLTSALEELDEAVKLSPRSGRARMLRAELHRTLGQTDAMEADLVWLSRNGGHPSFVLQLAEYFLEQDRNRDALSILESLEGQKLPETLQERSRTLAARARTRPWLDLLLDEAQKGRDRFEALDRVGRSPLPEVDRALVKLMEDKNLRLARLAWRTLRERTSWDLPFDPEAWSGALDRRDPSPSRP